MDNIDILYFTLDPESPCSRAVRDRPTVKMLKPEDDFSPWLPEIKAAIVDVEGDERQVLLKALLKEKLPFALCGLAGETPDSLKRLCAAAKRRHIQVCWLGSWRFEWAMARLREIISSGSLGTVQQLKLTKPEALGLFERLRDEDLLNWLAIDNDAAFAYEVAEDENFRVTATGTRGTATATLRPDKVNEFAVALEDERPRSTSAPSDPWKAEVGYLLFAIATGRPWSLLGKIPN
jgi:hypothetical protein